MRKRNEFPGERSKAPGAVALRQVRLVVHRQATAREGNREGEIDRCCSGTSSHLSSHQDARKNQTMPLTVEEYHQLWRERKSFPYDADLEPNSATVVLSPRSNIGGTGYAHFPDFGHLVCFCRYVLVELEFDPLEPLKPEEYDLPGMRMMAAFWEQHKPRLEPEEIARRRAACEEEFDRLLEEFVRDGYKPEMGERLLTIANTNFLDYELFDVRVLPGDLELLLSEVGNPLVDPDAGGEEAAAEAAPPFDLNNPEHRAALSYRLQISG